MEDMQGLVYNKMHSFYPGVFVQNTLDDRKKWKCWAVMGAQEASVASELIPCLSIALNESFHMIDLLVCLEQYVWMLRRCLFLQ